MTARNIYLRQIGREGEEHRSAIREGWSDLGRIISALGVRVSLFAVASQIAPSVGEQSVRFGHGDVRWRSVAVGVDEPREVRVVHLQPIGPAAAALMVKAKGVSSSQFHRHRVRYPERKRSAKARDDKLVLAAVCKRAEIGLKHLLILRLMNAAGVRPPAIGVIGPRSEGRQAARGINLCAGDRTHQLEPEIG